MNSEILKNEVRRGISLLNTIIGGKDAVVAWMMTVASVLTILGALFSHSNWLDSFYSFAAAWFAWGVHLSKSSKSQKAFISKC